MARRVAPAPRAFALAAGRERVAGERFESSARTSQTAIVNGVDFVSVATTDLAAAMDFYGDVLGLPRATVWQRAGEEPVGAGFETGSLTIALSASVTHTAARKGHGPRSHPRRGAQTRAHRAS